MVKWRSGLWAISAVAALPGAVAAETLADAMVMAYRTSPELAAGRADVKIFAEQAVQARALGRVQVEGTINATANFLDLERFVYPTTLSLDVVQPLYTGGQVENSTEAAETRITAEEARLLGTEQAILLGAVTAYSDVREAQTLVALSRNNVRVISEQLRAARERFNVGEVTRTDVSQAEARLEAARSLLAAQIGALETAREAYRRVVGQFPGDLEPPPPLPDLPTTAEQATALAMTDDPEVIAARLEREASGSDVKAAIGALLPQVSLVGQVANFDTLELSGDSSQTAAVGLQVTIPFYTGGFNYSNVREAQASVEGASADITTALREASQDVGEAWADLQVARASIQAGRLEVRAAQVAFEGVQEEAKVGARTTLDVLDAEQELLDARGSLVSSRRDEYVSAYTLLAAIGKLTVDHLGLEVDEPGDQPDVSSYYDSVKDRNFGYDRTDETVWSLSYRP